MENKCKIFKRGKKQTGITLVALVVTIVVLLILAGVSLNLVLSNNGIITKAGDAKDKYGKAKTNEQTDLDSAVDWIDDATGANEPEIVEPENIDDWKYTEDDDGTITINSYNGSATTVVIPNYINGKPVKKIGSTADKTSIWDDDICSGRKYGYYNMQKSIKEIVISEGIQEIGEYSFVTSEALEKIVISDSVDTIGEYAFKLCTELTDIVIPDSVTSIGKAAFDGCTGLTSIIIPDSVTTIGGWAFDGCTGLTSITIPESVTTIGTEAFYMCTRLTSITIPSSVTTLGRCAFGNIPSITVNVPFKEGETPEGWNSSWNSTDSGYNVTVNYAQ